MNRNMVIIIITSALVFGALIIFQIRPNVIDAWKIIQDTRIIKKEVNSATGKEKVLAVLAKDARINTIYDIAAKYIPETQSSGELVIELSAIANQNNLKVKKVSLETTPSPSRNVSTDETDTKETQPTPETSNEPLKQLKFSLTLDGSFPDFLNFIKSAETSSRLITFSTLNLNRTTDNLTAEISGVAYYKPKTTLKDELEDIQVSQATINQFQNLKTFGTPINLPTESGFGRVNPFDTTP